jgi:hypothetical protein
MERNHRPTNRFDPGKLLVVETLEDIRTLAPDSEGLLVRRLTDIKLGAIVEQVPRLRHLIADGSTTVTDSGLGVLEGLSRLECLDLEWSGVTDTGLLKIAAMRSLRWVDLGFCRGVSSRGVAELRQLRPDLDVVSPAVASTKSH